MAWRFRIAGRTLGAGLVLVCSAVIAHAQNAKDFASGEGGQPAVSKTTLNVARTADGAVLALPNGAVVRRTPAEVSAAHLIELADAPTKIATWSETDNGISQAYYAISLDGSAVDAVRPTDYRLKWRDARLDPTAGDAPVVTMLPAPAGNRMHVVQFVSMPLPVFDARIRQLGGTVRGYVPDHAYLVDIAPEQVAALRDLPFVRWAGPYHTAYRLDAPLRQLLNGQRPDPGAQRYRIRVFEKGPAQKSAVADAITGLGGVVNILSPGGFLLEATLTSAQLLAVAEMNEVEFIDRWSPPQTLMDRVRIVGGANAVESAAGYTGLGVRGEVMDDGCQISHPDFSGRIGIRGNTNIGSFSHGTATFGIVFGDGSGSASARGMMPDAFGFFNDFSLSTSRYDDLSELVQSPYDCLFQSNSWGFQDTTNYTTVSAEMDDAVFDFDLVVLHSQGNSGSQFSVEHAWGKNVVGVGGIIHFNTTTLNDDLWGFSGSIGPAADGRIKPDLCFWYDSIRTTAPGSSYTSSFGGTSAACPETAGHFGLFFQMWADGLFGNPVSGGSVFEERPHSSTARAVMINTATAYNFSGTGADLTRVHQGWGRPDVGRLYDLRDNMLVVDETDVLTALQSRTYVSHVTPALANHDELRVTLTYNDPAGTTSAGQHRINDMTLKVTSPGGTIYYGNNGLLAGNWSTSGGSPNTIDTVENVFIPNPQAGAWTIEVTAAEINQDGHIQTGAVDMDYALVISGGAPGTDCNENDVPDPCDISCAPTGCAIAGCGQSNDCNTNGIPDECEEPDCNGNSIPDECELDGNDCNTNGIPDDCELAGNDCNGNQVPDDCDEATLAETLTGPVDTTPCTGDPAVFAVTAPGATGYQWSFNGSPLSDGGDVSGATTAQLTVANTDAGDEGEYHCVVDFGCLSVASSVATLDLTANDLDAAMVTPDIIQACVSAGVGIAAFEVSVNDATGVSYQWDLNGTPLTEGGKFSGVQTPRIEISSPTGAETGTYTCTLSNGCAAVDATTSGVLALSAAFAQQPPATICAEYGSNAVITAVAANPPPDLYRWYEDGVLLTDGGNISGAFTDTLTIGNVQAGDDGRTFSLRLIVLNPPCTNYSDDVVLQTAPPGGCPACVTLGDMDTDGDFDLRDMQRFAECYGADVLLNTGCACANVDGANSIVDLADWNALVQLLTGPN
jgi:hypothetical protein